MMMRRQSLHRIDDSNSERRRVALQQCTLISVRADIPSIDLIDIPAPTGSPTLYCSSVISSGIRRDEIFGRDMLSRRSITNGASGRTSGNISAGGVTTMAPATRYVSIREWSATSWSAIVTATDISIAIMVMVGVRAGDGGGVTVGVVPSVT
jgi:hypothetical protein